MTKLDRAKQVVRENIDSARHGIFNNRNWVGDEMTVIYSHDWLQIEVCYDFEYFEVFGLSDDEFAELAWYYYTLV